jgi:hypothetical protein
MERLANGKSAEDVLRFLRDVHFPAHSDDIIHAASKNQAPNDIVGALGQLPRNEFASPEEVIDAYPRMMGGGPAQAISQAGRARRRRPLRRSRRAREEPPRRPRLPAHRAELIARQFSPGASSTAPDAALGQRPVRR